VDLGSWRMPVCQRSWTNWEHFESRCRSVRAAIEIDFLNDQNVRIRSSARKLICSWGPESVALRLHTESTSNEAGR
jgi:hypothetical protein